MVRLTTNPSSHIGCIAEAPARIEHSRQLSDSLDVINHPSGSAPDLVLINQALRNNSGWDIFNHLKRIATHIRAMVYVPDNLSTTNAAWIVKAVQEAIG